MHKLSFQLLWAILFVSILFLVFCLQIYLKVDTFVQKFEQAAIELVNGAVGPV